MQDNVYRIIDGIFPPTKHVISLASAIHDVQISRLISHVWLLTVMGWPYHHEMEHYRLKYVNELLDFTYRIFSWPLDYHIPHCRRSTPQIHSTILCISHLKDSETVIHPTYIRNDYILGNKFKTKFVYYILFHILT